MYLAGLRYSVAFLFEASFSVKLHYFFVIVEYSHKEKEAAYNCTSASLAVVAVEYGDTFVVFLEEMSYFVTDGEEGVEAGSFVIFPLVTLNILEYGLVDASSADVNGDVFVGVSDFEEFSNGVDAVAIKFFDAGCREGHGDDSFGDVGEIEVVAVFFESVFGSSYYLTQEVHLAQERRDDY